MFSRNSNTLSKAMQGNDSALSMQRWTLRTVQENGGDWTHSERLIGEKLF
jgi:hypothetical protein